MIKTLGIILIVIILGRIVIGPVRNYLDSFLRKDKSELREEQVIGSVSGYSPRVEEVQRILKDADFDPGPVDGIMGAQTRGAIREFQKANQLKPRGKIDSATWLALNREKEALRQEQKTEFHSEFTWHRLTTKDRIRQIQAALKKAGFYKGEVNGKSGPKTRRAIIAFQRSKRLKPDGVVGSKTWEELSKYLKD